MKTLYFDCFSGASGNMILGGLISLGVDPSLLVEEIKKLDIATFNLDVTSANKSGISAIHVKTEYPEEKIHRHLSDIEKIIDESRLSDSVKHNAKRVFGALGAAEAKVHGVAIEKIHFHEVGAMDAIIDVVGACIGFEILGIEKFVCSKIHVGSGFVKTDHGLYPVPPPAVAELLAGKPVYSTDLEGELVTPTGAAILTTFCESFGAANELELEKTGYGAGTRDYADFPNVLRMQIGTSSSRNASTVENLILLETNLDDMTGEALGYLLETAFERGALDCWFTPIQMKKNRPAVKISILTAEAGKDNLKSLLYTESSSIGLRVTSVRRECLERQITKVETRWGDIQIKLAYFEDTVVNVKPEFEQIRQIAESNNIAVKVVTAEVLKICSNLYEGASVIGTEA
jgi:uncharacterized protein (TIGR00299 family) protein